MQGNHAKEQGSLPPGDGAALESLVRAEKVKALYSKGVIALGANLVNSAILVAALWRVFPHDWTLVWMGLTYSLAAVRLVGWQRHQRAKDSPAYDASRWAREWLLGISLSGALWGSAGVLFHPPAHSLGTLYLVLFVIGGMVAGASASASSFLPAFTAFTLPALAPPVLYLCLSGDATHLTTAALLTLFGVGMTSVAWSGHRAIDEAIRLRFKNALLVEDLRAVTDELASLNRQLEERIAVRTKELEQAVADRDRFVSIVSHELRAPLSSMTLNLRLSSRLVGRVPAAEAAELQRYTDVLVRQAHRMLRLVDDLLDLSRLSTGRMQYQKVRVDLKSLIAATLEELAPQLAAAGAPFPVEAEDGLVGNWDPGRIQQVLVNLVTNALRHGAPPYSLSARRIDGDVEVVVRDSGRGIPPEALERIFEAFASARSGPTPGLGLGLHIAAQIVRAHDGSIRAESEPGRGASFIVRLRLLPR
ncbi:MAG TPA: HAMP domain-containing sensor histidine kinase [Myxococcales bacterium]